MRAAIYARVSPSARLAEAHQSRRACGYLLEPLRPQHIQWISTREESECGSRREMVTSKLPRRTSRVSENADTGSRRGPATRAIDSAV
jgi:hypothetical protein